MLNLTYSREKLEALCRQYHVSKLSVFGSTLRGDARPDSDLDLLVEFEPGKTPGYPFFTLQRELSGVFKKEVDLNTAGFLGRRFRNEIIRDAKPIYVS